MREGLEEIGQNYTVRRISLGVIGVAGLAVVIGLDLLLPHPPSIPDRGFLPTGTPTIIPIPSPTIRRKILPTPLGAFDSIQDCLRPLITKNSIRCLDDW